MDKSYGSVVYRKKENQLQFLLVQLTSTSFWDIPKGHAEDKETHHETAIREVLEETNYHIEFVSDFSEKIRYVLPRGEEKEVVFFLGKAIKKGQQIIDPQEINSVKWFNADEAIDHVTFDNSRDVLKKALLFLGMRIKGKHD